MCQENIFCNIAYIISFGNSNLQKVLEFLYIHLQTLIYRKYESSDTLTIIKNATCWNFAFARRKRLPKTVKRVDLWAGVLFLYSTPNRWFIMLKEGRQCTNFKERVIQSSSHYARSLPRFFSKDPVFVRSWTVSYIGEKCSQFCEF